MAGEIYNRAAASGYSNSAKSYDCDDLILWADDTHCYRWELQEMTHMSDDFIIVPYASEHYESLCEDLA